jgi:dipeptidyl aminopeptidase/acylaminoacyl peptidase
VLSKLDGVEIEKWLDAAKVIAPGGSPQFARAQCVHHLRYVNFLRDRLKLARKDVVAVELASPDGKSVQSLEMKLAEEPVRPPRPREGLRRTLEGNVGYLRLAVAGDDGAFARALHEAMAESRGTEGLVIDVRRGGGAGRLTLRALFPYFANPAEDKPAVVNVALYRLNKDKNEAAEAREGYLRDRGMFPITWAGWAEEERDAMATFAKAFEPEWKPPALEFSAWHCAVVSPSNDPVYYHYDKPVVVLADAGSSGAADVLLAAFKGRKNVTLMGTPSAGATGRSEGVRLAHSGVPVRICTTVSYRADGKLFDGRGVDPDVELWPQPDDFIGRTDSMLEAAAKRVKGG